MKYKKFTPDFWTQLKKTVTLLKTESSQLHAAFDADGTLWDTDLGENFFQYTIDNHLVPLPESPWDYYVNLKQKISPLSGKTDPSEAYVWLAQIYNNLPLNSVREWAKQAFDQIQPNPIFDEQKELIDYFLSENIKIHIVTASIKWAVEPGAEFLGLNKESVIGVETEIENNLITKINTKPVTYRAGKPLALKSKINSDYFFASGNSEGDIELLEKATHIRLAVSAASRDDKLYKTETALQQLAENKNWFFHKFIG